MGRQMAKTPIDRRAARSREMLHQALLSLIIEKGYEQITVEGICERANVGRSTFYAHFTSKDDLKRRGLEHLRRELIEQQRSASSAVDANVRGLAFTLTMFEHARDHIHLYRALVGSRGGAIALTTIRQLSPVYVDIQRPAAALVGMKNANLSQEVTLELDDGTVYGDGVNIAARLQALAEDYVGRVLKQLEEKGQVSVKGKTIVVFGTR